nr:hypothetical protein [Endozoicomonas sp.]
GRIDSAVLPEYIASQIEEAGEGHIIGYVGDETPWHLAGIFASKNMLKKHRGVVKKFLSAAFDSAKLYRKYFVEENGGDTDGYTTEKIKAAMTIGAFLKPALSTEQVIRYPVYIDPDGELDLTSIKRQLKWYQDHNMVKNAISFKDVVDIDLVKPLHGS